MNTHFRWTQLLPLVAVAALAGITWWLLHAAAARRGHRAAEAHTPDYFADNFGHRPTSRARPSTG